MVRPSVSQQPVNCHSGIIADVRELADSRYLTFAEIDTRVGNVRAVRRPVAGQSFELSMPWKTLQLAPGAAAEFMIAISQGQHATYVFPTGDDTERGTIIFSDDDH